MEPYTFETFVRMENERARQEAVPLVERTKELLDIIIEAKEIWESDHYPLEQVLVQVGWDWERLHPVIKEVFLKEIGDYLGIDLVFPPNFQKLNFIWLDIQNRLELDTVLFNLRV
jgi:hypothetical protein